MKCAFVALTGRGVVSIIQAIVGVIFSIEGFWGAVKFDGPTVKRFLIFLVAYFFVSAAISVINLQTLDEYCSTAVDANDKRYCLDTSRLYSYLLLAATLAVLVSPAAQGGGGREGCRGEERRQLAKQTRRRHDAARAAPRVVGSSRLCTCVRAAPVRPSVSLPLPLSPVSL